MNSGIDPKTLTESTKISLSVKEIKEIIRLGSFLIYVSVTITGFCQSAPPKTKIEKASVTEPIFYLVDSTGLVIDTKNGIKAGSPSMKVMAGSNFRVREMEIIISRGSTRIASIMATNNVTTTAASPGDRITIIIKRVMKTTANGERDAAFNNGIIKISIL